jgi:hypothetical protein
MVEILLQDQKPRTKDPKNRTRTAEPGSLVLGFFDFSFPFSRKAPRLRVNLYAPAAPVARSVPALPEAPLNPTGTTAAKAL